jgi:hypothetical protein
LPFAPISVHGDVILAAGVSTVGNVVPIGAIHSVKGAEMISCGVTVAKLIGSLLVAWSLAQTGRGRSRSAQRSTPG